MIRFMPTKDLKNLYPSIIEYMYTWKTIKILVDGLLLAWIQVWPGLDCCCLAKERNTCSKKQGQGLRRPIGTQRVNGHFGQTNKQTNKNNSQQYNFFSGRRNWYLDVERNGRKMISSVMEIQMCHELSCATKAQKSSK